MAATTEKITVRLANQPDHDGFYTARVYCADEYNKTFVDRNRDAALEQAVNYAAWLRDGANDSEEVIEL